MSPFLLKSYPGTFLSVLGTHAADMSNSKYYRHGAQLTSKLSRSCSPRAGLSSQRLGIPTPGRSEIITYHLSVGHTDWSHKCYFGLRVGRRPQETTKPGSRGPTAPTAMGRAGGAP